MVAHSLGEGGYRDGADGAGSGTIEALLRRDTLETIGSFGHRGYYGGEFAGYIHSIATDSKGNIYVGEFPAGNRVNRFKMIAAGE